MEELKGTITSPQPKMETNYKITYNQPLIYLKKEEDNGFSFLYNEEDYLNNKTLNEKNIFKIISNGNGNIKEKYLIGNGAIYLLEEQEYNDVISGIPSKRPSFIKENEKYYSIPSDYENYLNDNKKLDVFLKENLISYSISNINIQLNGELISITQNHKDFNKLIEAQKNKKTEIIDIINDIKTKIKQNKQKKTNYRNKK